MPQKMLATPEQEKKAREQFEAITKANVAELGVEAPIGLLVDLAVQLVQQMSLKTIPMFISWLQDISGATEQANKP